VRHILVKTKAQADDIYNQLKAGANFAALAKSTRRIPARRTTAASSRSSVGNGRPFDTTAFLLSTNDLAAGQDAVRLPRDPADRGIKPAKTTR
jgi:hypothetical protein